MCLCSHEPSLTAYGVSSNEVVCHATELVASPAVPIAPWGLYSPVCPVQGCTRRSGGQQAPRAAELPVAWPGAWAPGTWLVDLVALRAVLS